MAKPSDPGSADSSARLLELEQRFEETLEREKLAALKQFAYGLSHEINNPLTNIATRAQMLLAGEIDPARKKALATINAQAFKAFEMIADLMLFAHPPALARTDFGVADLLEQLAREHSVAAAEQHTQLAVLAASSADLTITADRNQLAAALAAIIKNALEALRAGGEVRVSASLVSQEVPTVTFAVDDTGPGITAEIRRHLFDPFFSGREAGRGLGLGLSKAYRVAELHGGTLQVESELGRGAHFQLTIPQHPPGP
jgi:signal transduction histidine kinase